MRSAALDEIVARLQQAQRDLEKELDRLLEQKRQQFEYHLQRGRVIFKKRMRLLQRQHRTGVWRYIADAPIAYILTAPLIYGMIFPLLLLDLSLTVYQHICFRVYRIPLLRRRDFLLIDHQYLAYLNMIEKLNCIYCSYGNGLIEYARAITARTEQYWCPIKHARRSQDPHALTAKFFDYGDAEAFRLGLERLRNDWDDSNS